MLSRSGVGSQLYSLGYICLESSKNFVGIREAVTLRCYVEKVFLEISKNTFSYRTSLVAISGITHNLKLVSAIFYQIFIFSPNDSQMFFISSKKLFSLLRYLNFCDFFTYLSTLSRFKRTNRSGIMYDVMI